MQLIDLNQEANQLADQVTRELRDEAVDHVNEALDMFVRDGHCDLLVRIAGIPLDEWAEIEADEYRHPNGLPMKREWLSGAGSHLVIEFVADPDSGEVAA